MESLGCLSIIGVFFLVWFTLWVWRRLWAPFKPQGVGHVTKLTPWDIMVRFLLVALLIVGVIVVLVWPPSQAFLVRVTIVVLRSIADLLDALANMLEQWYFGSAAVPQVRTLWEVI